MASAVSAAFDPAKVWTAEELAGYPEPASSLYPDIDDSYGDAKTKFNPTPGVPPPRVARAYAAYWGPMGQPRL